jgi:hypothetical protein
MWKKAILCGAIVGLLCSASMAVPIDYKQRWNGYGTTGGGVHDPNYVAEWQQIEANRYAIKDNGSPWIAPNALKVKKDQSIGIMHDLHVDDTSASENPDPSLAPGELVVGPDDDVLTVSFYLDMGSLQFTNNYADFFTEMGLGNAHAPTSPAGGAADVLAFGMTYGINGFDDQPYFFDGVNWNRCDQITTVQRWNKFFMDISSTTVTLRNDATGDSQTFARQYLGAFDTVSHRTIDNDGQSQEMWADTTYITGGNIVPEPATLSLCVLGGLALLRRRR